MHPHKQRLQFGLTLLYMIDVWDAFPSPHLRFDSTHMPKIYHFWRLNTWNINEYHDFERNKRITTPNNGNNLVPKILRVASGQRVHHPLPRDRSEPARPSHESHQRQAPMSPRPGVLPVYAQHAQAVLKTAQRLEETNGGGKRGGTIMPSCHMWYTEMIVTTANQYNIYIYILIYIYI